jgi:hypothetical protein
LVRFGERNIMSTFELTGLHGGNPLGFLAAVGVLRLSAEYLRLRNPQLFWNDEPYWYPRLTVDDELSESDFQQQLLDAIRRRPDEDEFLQHKERQYSLASLDETPQLLGKILLSSSFRTTLLTAFPDIESAEALLSEDRASDVRMLFDIVFGSMLDSAAKDAFWQDFAARFRKAIEKTLKPLKKFGSLKDADKLRQLSKRTFLTTLTDRFLDLDIAEAFFTDPRSRDFFAVLETALVPIGRNRAKPPDERIREMLTEILSERAARKEGATSESQEEAEEGTFFFENGRVIAGINDHKIPLPIFRRWLNGADGYARKPNQDRFLRFLAGYGTDLAAKDGSTILPSALLMLSGQQKLFPSILSIPASADLAGIEEALKGPWKRTDPRSSLGLDPERLQSHATSAMDPSKSGQRRTALAVWLAMEALPLFPVIPVAHDAAHTASFDRRETHARGMRFAWALWSAPMSIFSIGTLISQISKVMHEPPFPAQEFDGTCLDEFIARGITAFFCCEKEQNGKYFNFLPARRIA